MGATLIRESGQQETSAIRNSNTSTTSNTTQNITSNPKNSQTDILSQDEACDAYLDNLDALALVPPSFI